MREMKDSGIEWIGSIPQNWKLERLQWHMEEVNIGNNPIQAYRVLSLTNKLGVVPYEEKGNQGNKAKANYSEYKLAYPETLVVNSMNVIIGSVGISNYFGCVSPVYYVFKAKEKNNIHFLNYYFQTTPFQKELRRYANGILEIRLRISSDSILKRTVPVPNIHEQERIVTFLDKKCTEIDVLTADIEAQIETLEQYKRSLITEVVTKGLDPDVEMKDSGIEWLHNVPANWQIMPNKYLMSKVKKICPVYNGEDILSLTMNGVVVRDLDAGGKMPTSFNGYQKVEPGNLLMCLFDIDVTPRCVGLIQQSGLTSPAYSQFILNDNADARYYCYYYTMLDNDKTLLHLAKNLRHSLTEEQLGTIPTLVPPLDEQEEIANYLDSKCKEIDVTIADKQKQLETLTEYKKSLIYEYVTGKKEVPLA